jgi:hypothetical protein
MEKRDKARADERGISPRALAATATNEAPGPGAERTPWAGSQAAAGARPPTGAVSSRGRAFEDFEGGAFEELILSAASRILAHAHGNAATLRLPQLLEETGIRVAPVHYSVVADILRKHPVLDGWKLVKVERGAFRYIRLTYRCPLCGKVIRRSSAAAHAFMHIERLERCGVLKLSREGGWVVVFNGKKYIGVGWRTLCALAERLAREGVMVSG